MPKVEIESHEWCGEPLLGWMKKMNLWKKRTDSFCNYMTVMWDSKIRGDIQQLWSDVLLHLESFGYDFLPNVKILAKELKVLGRYLKGVNWVKYPRFLVLESTDWSVIFVMFFFCPCLDFICQPDCVKISSRGWPFHLCCGKFRASLWCVVFLSERRKEGSLSWRWYLFGKIWCKYI